MSGNRLILDTNIILGFLTGRPDTTKYLNEQPEAELFVSAITRMEVLSFSAITHDEEQAITKFLNCVTVIPVDARIESTAIELRRATRCKLPDAIIAATARRLESTFVTHDADLAKISYPDLVTVNPSATQ